MEEEIGIRHLIIRDEYVESSANHVLSRETASR